MLSTYGEGDPSDNAGGLWDWANKLAEAALPNLRYAAFGLGNSDYRYYNRVVDVVDAALQRAGASRLLETGRADDAHGTTEEDFLEWKDGAVAFLARELGLEQREVAYEPVYNVVEDPSLDLQDLHAGEPTHASENAGKGAAMAGGTSPIRPIKVRESRELFAGGAGRHCLHMELDITEDAQVSYKTGDHLAVWAMNPEEEVERLLAALGRGGADRRAVPLMITALDGATKVRVPTPTTAETMLRHYLEVCAPLSRDTVAALAAFAPTPAAAAFLRSASRDRDAFAALVASTHVNLGRLLAAAAPGGETWDAVPLSFLIEVLPRMQPRYYSISSSSIIAPRAPAITALVSSTPLADAAAAATAAPIPGLATNYLLALSNSMAASPAAAHPAGLSYRLDGPEKALAGARLYAHVRRSKFKLPMQSAHPIIMVAAGTGLAPFRAFVAERARLLAMGRDVGRMLLFFGCRRPDEDYIYREELAALEAELDGRLRIVTAFSRVQGQDRVYVQDRVREAGREVCQMLEDDGTLYICGRASMAREVGRIVGEVMGADKGWEEPKKREWSNNMKRNRKWQEDVWG